MDRYKTELEKVRSSKSWRLTKPLRVLSASLKKVLKKAENIPISTADRLVVNSINNTSYLDSNNANAIMRMSAVAEIAMEKNNWLEATERWKELIARYDNNTPTGVYVRLSICYRKLNKLKESQSLTVKSLRNHPDFMPLYIENAEIAMEQNNWALAIKRWKLVKLKFPEKYPTDVLVKISRAYRFDKKYSQATIIIEDALNKHPDDKRILMEAAEVATASNDRNLALKRWRILIKSLNKKSSLQDWLKLKDGRVYVSVVSRLMDAEAYVNRIKLYNQKKSSANGRLKTAVFTAIVGDYDSIKLPEVLENDIDYYLYTDKSKPNTNIFKIKLLPYIHADKTRSARFVKTHPHLLLNDYEIAVWIDASILIIEPLKPLINDFIASGKPIAAMPHPDRSTIYQEGQACIDLKKDDEPIIRQQMKNYMAEGFESSDLVETGILMFNMSHKKTSEFLNIWWREIDKNSKRDQLSINYAMSKSNINWHPLSSKPIGIRNHPSFILDSHSDTKGQMKELIEKVQVNKISPFKFVPFNKMKNEIVESQFGRSIDVIVCVYNALDDVKKCLLSIEANRNKNTRLVIVDDGSENKTAEFLIRFSSQRVWTKLKRNDQSLGYSKAANIGMKESSAEMVVLLNSDTVVTSNWLEKISGALFSSEDIGIVGPLSSAASHQSIPEHKSSDSQTAINQLPKGFSAEDMNLKCEDWSRANYYPRVPLVHGFCFAIKKSVIDKIGYFDDKSFPRGYGEENDYCFRATDVGFSLAIATNTYIYHEKSKSYKSSERTILMKNGSAQLVELYGRERITRAVVTMQVNPELERIRKKAEKLYE